MRLRDDLFLSDACHMRRLRILSLPTLHAKQSKNVLPDNRKLILVLHLSHALQIEPTNQIFYCELQWPPAILGVPCMTRICQQTFQLRTLTQDTANIKGHRLYDPRCHSLSNARRARVNMLCFTTLRLCLTHWQGYLFQSATEPSSSTVKRQVNPTNSFLRTFKPSAQHKATTFTLNTRTYLKLETGRK